MSASANLYWHFLPADCRLTHGDGRLVQVGETLTVPKRPLVGIYGLHAASKAMDALEYAPGPVVCRVTLGGNLHHNNSLSAGSERTVVAMADATPVLHEFACWSAEQALHLTGDAEPTCRKAIETKRAWLRGEATDADLAAARAAARDAARDAAWAAARAAQEAELTARLTTLLGLDAPADA